ncbi:hypothetical protein ACFXKF_39950 [Streptomyces scopuliridis]|uniref:hypothetical protein n=1 Tax=Streptomyces scopuliridis TaxID=452529 RepID=UPI003675EBA2
MTDSRKPRLLPTGDCFCGCGGEAGIGRWFVLGHDITAAAALRAVEGASLPQRLVAAGYGPERSVVAQAVSGAGWVRCGGCAYAGSPARLAVHVRGGECDGAGQAAPAGAGEPAAGEDAPAAEELPETVAPGEGRRRRARDRRTGGEDTGPVRAEAGPAQGLLLPGTGDEMWKKVPLHLRGILVMPAHRLVTPEQAVLREKGNREVKFALRAAGNRRMTGKHWHALLTAPRESFGTVRSERADRVFEALQQVVAEYVAPAIEKAPEGAVVETSAG